MRLFRKKKTDHGAITLENLAACDIYKAADNDIKNKNMPKSSGNIAARSALEVSKNSRMAAAVEHNRHSKSKIRRPNAFKSQCKQNVKHINTYLKALEQYKTCDAKGQGKKFNKAKNALSKARAKLPAPVIAALADYAVANGAQINDNISTAPADRTTNIRSFESASKIERPDLFGNINLNYPSDIAAACNHAKQIYVDYQAHPKARFQVAQQDLNNQQVQQRQVPQQPMQRQAGQRQPAAQQPIRQHHAAQQLRAQQPRMQQPARSQPTAQRQAAQRPAVKTQTAEKKANWAQRGVEMKARLGELAGQAPATNMPGAVISPTHLQQMQASQANAVQVQYSGLPAAPSRSFHPQSTAVQATPAIPTYDSVPPITNVQLGAANSAAMPPASLVAAANANANWTPTNVASTGSPFMQRQLQTGSPFVQRAQPVRSPFVSRPLPAALPPLSGQLPPPMPVHFRNAAAASMTPVDISSLPPAPGQAAAVAGDIKPTRAAPTLPPRPVAATAVASASDVKPKRAIPALPPRPTAAAPMRQNSIFKPTRPAPNATQPSSSAVQYGELPTDDQRRADQYLQGTETTSNAVARQGRYAASTATASSGLPPQSQLHTASAAAQAKAEHNARPAAPRSATTTTQPGRVAIPTAFKK